MGFYITLVEKIIIYFLSGKSTNQLETMPYKESFAQSDFLRISTSKYGWVVLYAQCYKDPNQHIQVSHQRIEKICFIIILLFIKTIAIVFGSNISQTR